MIIIVFRGELGFDAAMEYIAKHEKGVRDEYVRIMARREQVRPSASSY